MEHKSKEIIISEQLPLLAGPKGKEPGRASVQVEQERDHAENIREGVGV
jgi:hypothetical protein